ncbi:hypothetical protein QIG18_26295, partial [Klebsiella pneumoniae]|nr:hypothetical protein [Klebsiella pneumoniae]
GSYQGETPGIFIVLSGFAATDLSVRFYDTRQGGGAYGKTATPHPFPVSQIPALLVPLSSVSR